MKRRSRKGGLLGRLHVAGNIATRNQQTPSPAQIVREQTLQRGVKGLIAADAALSAVSLTAEDEIQHLVLSQGSIGRQSFTADRGETDIRHPGQGLTVHIRVIKGIALQLSAYKFVSRPAKTAPQVCTVHICLTATVLCRRLIRHAHVTVEVKAAPLLGIHHLGAAQTRERVDQEHFLALSAAVAHGEHLAVKTLSSLIDGCNLETDGLVVGDAD